MFKSILLIIALAGTCQLSFAYGVLSEQDREQKINEILKTEVAEAKKIYEDKYNTCYKQSLENPISIEIFKQKQLNLTLEEAKYSLFYWYERNFLDCIGEASSNYLVALDTAKHYKVSDLPKYIVPDLPINIMKYKADYLAISKEKRERIESIEELKVLFNPQPYLKDY